MDVGMQNIILAPGSRHLFWTGGVYYLWELSKRYNIIMLVDKEFADDLDFIRMIELASVLKVFYIPKVDILNRHRFYSTKVKWIVSEYNPVLIFHHDPVYVSMMYLYYWGKKNASRCICISYLTGMSSIDWEREVESIVTFNVNLIVNKYNLPYSWASFWFTVRSRLSLILNYYLLPLIFIGKFFSPPLNPADFTTLKQYWNDQFDYYLLYSDSDREITGKVFGSDNGIQQIKHPIQSVGNELNSILYNFEESDIILILPSYGHVDVYQKKHKIPNEEIVALISSNWNEVINVLKSIFPNYQICWKLHPAQADDFLWHNIQDKVKQNHPDLSLLRPNENAQKWILKSKIIVGEVSSVLWWASFFPNKIPISLDIFGIPFMDGLKNYEGIYYFNNIDDLYNTDFAKQHHKDKMADNSHPTLTEFLDLLSVP